MARYIDADKFVKQFERALEHQQKYGLYNHAKLTEYVIKAIENEPTADVVPKSEVEKIAEVAKQNIDSANERAETFRVASEKSRVLQETARATVAREIFEEIEKAHNECIWIDITTRIGYLQQTKFEHKLAELKKKYTEVDDAGK